MPNVLPFHDDRAASVFAALRSPERVPYRYDGLCPRCGVNPKPESGQRYCRPCANAYMREWRSAGGEDVPGPRATLTVEERRKRGNARAAVKMRLRRGTMTAEPCEICGTSENVEAHHDDYDQPFDVRWLCGKHHRAHHRAEARRR